MISQNSQRPKLDDLFSELTSVTSHVQLQQQISGPPEGQVQTWEQKIIPYNKQKIEEKQLLSWASGKNKSSGKKAWDFSGLSTTIKTGWQHWRGPYLHRINLQTSKGGWAGSEGQSGIPFTESESVMNGRILQPGNQKESEQKQIIPSRGVVN